MVKLPGVLCHFEPLVVPQWGREKSSKEVFQQHKLIFKMPASHGFDSKHMLLCSPGCVVVTCLTFLKMPQYAHLYFFFFFLKGRTMRLVLFFSPFKSALISTLHTTRHAVSSLSSLSHVLMDASLRTHAFTLLQLVHLAVSATPILTLA